MGVEVHFPRFYNTLKILWFQPLSERCESQRAAPDRNANTGELIFVPWWLLRLTKRFVLSVSQ